MVSRWVAVLPQVMIGESKIAKPLVDFLESGHYLPVIAQSRGIGGKENHHKVGF